MFIRVARPGSRTSQSTLQRPPQVQRANYSFWNRFNSFWNKGNDEENNTPISDPNTLRRTLHEHEPSWFSPDKKSHHDIQEETTESVIDPDKFQALLSQANLNLTRWSHNKKTSPQQIEVVRGDWGVITQEVTSTYGETYAVLNMANAYFFGGAFLDGGSAQEENMIARTSCSNHIFSEEADAIYLDKNHFFRYKDEKTLLINGQTPMTPEELAKLSAIRGKDITRAYKIHMDTMEPEVCFRGPEIFANIEKSSFDDNPKASGRVALSPEEGSFALLRVTDIFPFHELRSAALDLTDRNINVDWNDPVFLAWFRKETKQRIDAQLDTALLNGIKHVVLGAFGCGAFKNEPEEVAKIYRESIEERAEHFEHIIFPIYRPGYGRDNFPAFEKELSGIALGAKAAPVVKSSFRLGSTSSE